MLREKAKASRRRAILGAAGKQFARRPYHEVLLDDIAADAEVAKGTLYLYFENKADLYLALIVESMEPLIRRLEEQVPIAASQSAWAGVRLLIENLLAFNVEHPALHEVLRETSRASLEAICGDLKKSLATLLEQTLRKGVASGEIVDPAPEVTTDLILATIPRAAPWMTLKRNKWTAEAMTDHLLRLVGEGLLSGRK
jgi:TetR/AcrR family fatty acid metabolism transcriptional regulator